MIVIKNSMIKENNGSGIVIFINIFKYIYDNNNNKINKFVNIN